MNRFKLDAELILYFAILIFPFLVYFSDRHLNRGETSSRRDEIEKKYPLDYYDFMGGIVSSTDLITREYWAERGVELKYFGKIAVTEIK